MIHLIKILPSDCVCRGLCISDNDAFILIVCLLLLFLLLMYLDLRYDSLKLVSRPKKKDSKKEKKD